MNVNIQTTPGSNLKLKLELNPNERNFSLQCAKIKWKVVFYKGVLTKTSQKSLHNGFNNNMFILIETTIY
jgi:hypothetical protein